MGMSILRNNGFDKLIITEAGGAEKIAAECGIQLTPIVWKTISKKNIWKKNKFKYNNLKWFVCIKLFRNKKLVV